MTLSADGVTCGLRVLSALVLPRGASNVVCQVYEFPARIQGRSVRRVARESFGQLGFVVCIDLRHTGRAIPPRMPAADSRVFLQPAPCILFLLDSLGEAS